MVRAVFLVDADWPGPSTTFRPRWASGAAAIGLGTDNIVLIVVRGAMSVSRVGRILLPAPKPDWGELVGRGISAREKLLRRPRVTHKRRDDLAVRSDDLVLLEIRAEPVAEHSATRQFLEALEARLQSFTGTVASPRACRRASAG